MYISNVEFKGIVARMALPLGDYFSLIITNSASCAKETAFTKSKKQKIMLEGAFWLQSLSMTSILWIRM
jgi:hypothetical protein